MYYAINACVALLKKIVPRSFVKPLRTPYHYLLSLIAAIAYGFPARKLTVIGVTGTKGKSSVADMLYTTLRDTGHRVAVASTIRFAMHEVSEPNRFKMTMPGRGFIQHFLARAVKEGCTHAVVEITSESTRDFRHKFLFLDALVFTNLQKEHIEAHGSFEKYAAAKMKIGKALVKSTKRNRAIIANADDPASSAFLALPVEQRLPFYYAQASDVELLPGRASFTYDHERFSLQLPGSFSIMNALAVITAARFIGTPLADIKNALAGLTRIPGRTERIEAGQPFNAIVDYAHTPDSLAALYAAYPGRKICVLGNTGGGRDTWKRPEMGRIADEACHEVILTDEDPYDEDPSAIVAAMAAGMKREPRIILDRREAIRTALSLATEDDTVLITGKGTDPCICRANGAKEPWSDADTVREALTELNEAKKTVTI